MWPSDLLVSYGHYHLILLHDRTLDLHRIKNLYYVPVYKNLLIQTWIISSIYLIFVKDVNVNLNMLMF